MSGFLDQFRTIRARRKALRARYDIRRSFERLEESCVPAYCHRNWAAAAVSWMRLMRAAAEWRRHAPQGPVLDFGAASGELAHFIDARPYHFIEGDDFLANAARSFVPESKRRTLDDLEPGEYAAVFALDSLEHNQDVASLVDRLIPVLRDDGVFILSGPTENLLYRLGRKIAGYSGHYHTTNIYSIEAVFARRMTCVRRVRVPFGLPLFYISVWRIERQ